MVLLNGRKGRWRDFHHSKPAVCSFERIPKVNWFCTKAFSKNDLEQLILK